MDEYILTYCEDIDDGDEFYVVEYSEEFEGSGMELMKYIEQLKAKGFYGINAKNTFCFKKEANIW